MLQTQAMQLATKAQTLRELFTWLQAAAEAQNLHAADVKCNEAAQLYQFWWGLSEKEKMS